MGFWASTEPPRWVPSAHSWGGLVSAIGSLQPRKEAGLSAQAGWFISLLPRHLYAQ